MITHWNWVYWVYNISDKPTLWRNCAVYYTGFMLGKRKFVGVVVVMSMSHENCDKNWMCRWYHVIVDGHWRLFLKQLKCQEISDLQDLSVGIIKVAGSEPIQSPQAREKSLPTITEEVILFFFHQRAVHPIPPMLDAPSNHGECRGSKQIWLGPSYGGHFRQLLTQAGFFGLEFGENSAFSKPCLWTARDFGPVLPPAMSRNII